MTSNSPLGTLSVLPRELRDKIYHKLISNKYYIFYSPLRFIPYSENLVESSREPRWRQADLAILRTSKSIYHEVTSRLHIAEFTFYVERFIHVVGPFANSNSVAYNPFKNLNHLMLNVEIILDLSSSFNFERDEDFWGTFDTDAESMLAKAQAGPLSFFAGSQVSRNTMVIRLAYYAPCVINITSSPLFHAIQQLTGFHTVVLLTDDLCSLDEWLSDETLITQVGRKYGARHWRKMFARHQTLLNEIGKELEPSLGPYNTSRFDPILPRNDLNCSITFHPLVNRDEIREVGLIPFR